MKPLLRPFSLLLVTGLLFGASASRAASLPFTATLEIQILGLAPSVMPGAGTAIANGSAGGTHLDSLALAGSTFATTGQVQPVTDPVAFPIAGIQLTAHNGPANFTGGGAGTLGGVMPILGVAKVCLFGPCASAVSNLSVPLSPIGQGGYAHISGAVNLTVIGAAWTTGTAAVGTITAMGSAHGPASATSSTFAVGGTLQLVTPARIFTHIGASPVIPAFGILTLHFVPEPGTIALIGCGVALLGAIGRSRRV
jgi:hypothetical protein